jgi:hypothetical protein
MTELLGHAGQRLGLQVLGYEFPTNANNKYDANWLRINVRVVHREGTWESADPSLLTWELEALADWFERIADGAPVGWECSFTEPNLRFQLRWTPGARKLRAYFELESRPPWARRDGLFDDLFVDFDVDPVALRAAASDLRQQLRRFPERTADT